MINYIALFCTHFDPLLGEHCITIPSLFVFTVIPVQNGIYIIMGANIGTSVTNTIVAMGQVTNKEEFRRAFAGATVLDVFNWLAVFILLPIEVLTGYLYYLTLEIVNSINVDADVDDPQFLQVITDPVVSAIISVSRHHVLFFFIMR